MRPLSISLLVATVNAAVDVAPTEDNVALDDDANLTSTSITGDTIKALPEDDDALMAQLQALAAGTFLGRLFTPKDRADENLDLKEPRFSATYNGQTRQTTAPVPALFQGATVRFQAGDYQQADDPGGAQDGGRVIFHRLAQQPTTP